jgi:hypothetical protein
MSCRFSLAVSTYVQDLTWRVQEAEPSSSQQPVGAGGAAPGIALLRAPSSIELLVEDGASVLALDAKQVEELTGISMEEAPCQTPASGLATCATSAQSPSASPVSPARGDACLDADDTGKHGLYSCSAGSGKKRRLEATQEPTSKSRRQSQPLNHLHNQASECRIEGLVLAVAWRYDMPPPLLPTAANASDGGLAGIADGDCSHDAQAQAPAHHAQAKAPAHPHVLCVSQKRVLVVTLQGQSLECAGKRVHVYMNRSETWIPRGLLPGARVCLRHLILCTPLHSAGAPDTVCRAGPHTHVVILRTAIQFPASDSIAPTPSPCSAEAQCKDGTTSRVRMGTGHAEAGVMPEEDMVRVCHLQACVERARRLTKQLTMQGSITSLWRVTIERVCSVCEGIGACKNACKYALLVKAEGKFEDGSGTCRMEFEGQELVLRGLLRMSKPAMQELVAAAQQFGRLTFQRGIHLDECLKHAQTSAILATPSLILATPAQASPVHVSETARLPSSRQQGLSKGTMLLYNAVEQALVGGMLTHLRVTAEQLPPLVGGRMGSGGGKGVVIGGKALGTTAYRPEVAPCSRRACARVFALLRVNACVNACVCTCARSLVRCGEEARGHRTKQ